MFLISDGVFDLFTGYENDGELEKKLMNVLRENLSWRLFLEIIISFGPQLLLLYINDD
jgi:hypothetical protein